MATPPLGDGPFHRRNRIVYPRQVLVEGNDEVALFRALASQADVSELQFQPYNGKNNLRDFLETIVADPDFAAVSSLAVVMDADDDRGAAVDRVRGALENAGLSAPDEPLRMSISGHPRTGWLVIPHDAPGRMLEDVCLESVKDAPALACVEEFLQCLKNECPNPPRDSEESKAKMHAFLASMSPPDRRLGEAAYAGVWNFDDSSFEPLKSLLSLL